MELTDQEISDCIIRTRQEFALDLSLSYRNGIAVGEYRNRLRDGKMLLIGILIGAIGTLVALAWKLGG